MPLERASEELSVLDAYDAMRAFIEAYWERGGRASDELAILLTSLQRLPNGGPLDPAQWPDWIAAIDDIRSKNRV